MARRAAAALALSALLAAGAAAEVLTGRVTLPVEGTSLAELGPTVVFLESVGGRVDLPPAKAPPVLRQRNARFDPSFLVAVAGQSVRFANDDTIFHNVFSFSRPNDFNLGVYPAGESRSVRLAHAGVVKVYCSIHESMTATVLVTPTPLLARASAAGEYRVEGVPTGTFDVTVWNQRLPAVTRRITVGGGTARLDVALGGRAP